MAFVEWTQEYSVGVRLFDDDHKILIDIANKLHDSVLAGSADDALNDAMSALDTYVQVHFRHEEEIFERTGYPNAVTHKGQHDIAKMMFTSIRSGASRADVSQLAMELAKVLKGWLLLHIQEEDKQYSAFLNSKGIR